MTLEKDHTNRVMLHPAEVAKELRTFPFFKKIGEDLLLQVATMVKTRSLIAGEILLKEGEENNCLYFLRSGQMEVLLAGEVVAILSNRGEVAGEMSVVSALPVATTVRSLTDSEVFVVDSKDFSLVHPKERDRFEALLYRIYSIILVDRLSKTNEKARLFEIANRELHQAQKALDAVSGKSVLLVETDRKQLALAKMSVGGTGVSIDTASDDQKAIELSTTKEFDAIVCDESTHHLLSEFKTTSAQQLVLMTPKDVSSNISLLRNLEFVDNVFARDHENRAQTARVILTALSKVLSRDVFGLEKYLTWGVDVQQKAIKSSRDRETLRDEMVAYLKTIGVRTTISDRCNSVVEELLMNAIYDAPVDSQGRSLFNHLSRKNEIVLDTHQQSSLRYACDGIFVAISVSDPFGALTKKTIIDYLDSCYSGNAGTLNEGKGGAGRGLHMIIENADVTIFNVKKGVRTEVICLFAVELGNSEPRPSLHYFFV